MTKEAIATKDAPAAIGPYSQAVRAGELVFLSGQIPLDPATGQIVEGDIAAQTQRVMENLRAVLAAAGCSFRRRRADDDLPRRPRALREGQRDVRRALRGAVPGARDRAGRGAAARRAGGDRRDRRATGRRDSAAATPKASGGRPCPRTRGSGGGARARPARGRRAPTARSSTRTTGRSSRMLDVMKTSSAPWTSVGRSSRSSTGSAELARCSEDVRARDAGEDARRTRAASRARPPRDDEDVRRGALDDAAPRVDDECLLRATRLRLAQREEVRQVVGDLRARGGGVSSTRAARGRWRPRCPGRRRRAAAATTGSTRMTRSGCARGVGIERERARCRA